MNDYKPSMQHYQDAANYLKEYIPEDCKIAITLGSGLGNLANKIQEAKVIDYADIPHFPTSTAMGHKGKLIIGKLGGKNVIAMQGRFHYYEGYPMSRVTFHVRVFKLLGIEYLFVSNAAGGTNAKLKLGDLMMIEDHINLLPNPLIGQNIDEFGPRFSDMTRAYDRALMQRAEDIATSQGLNLKRGVYVGWTGPSYETPAEYRFLSIIGGDAIGMSTVPEVIVARHCNIRVFGVSVITNEGYHFDDDFVNDGDDVIKAANAASDKMTALFEVLIASL